MSRTRPGRGARLICLLLSLLTTLSSPSSAASVVSAADGVAYVLDQRRGVVLRYSPGGALEVWARFEPAVHGIEFRRLVRDRDGRLYTAPRSGAVVWRLDPASAGAVEPERVYPPSGLGSGAVPVGQDGTPFVVWPAGGFLCVDPSDRGRLLEVALDGSARPFAAEPRDGLAWSDLDLRKGGLVLDADGSVLAVAGVSRIVRCGRDGSVALLAGGKMTGYLDGPGAEARFAAIRSIGLDHDGALIVADLGNRRVRRVGPDGAVTTVATLDWHSQPSAVTPRAGGGYLVVVGGQERLRLLSVDAAGDIEELSAFGGTPNWIYLVPSIVMTIIVLVFMLGGASLVVRRQRARALARRAPPGP